ncbi:hypothetical protein [Pantoea agglomerans]|uniref:hypothetical protein n=1 Tax=Enterobacter agglomerans TaxID=549 RepID=UPI003C7BEE39
MKSISGLRNTKKLHSSDDSGEKSKSTYKIVEINLEHKGVVIVDFNKNETFKKCFIIIEMPAGEYLTGPYDTIELAQVELLRLFLTIDKNHK